MKIIVRVSIGYQMRNIFALDPLLCTKLDWDAPGSWQEMSGQSPVLERVIDLSHQTDGLRFQVFADFSKKEVESVSLYLMRPTREDIAMTAEEQTANYEYFESLKYRRFNSELAVKVVGKIFASAAKLRTDIDNIYTAFGCYLATENVSQVFTNEQVTGLSLGSVIDLKSISSNRKLGLLVPSNVLPACAPDGSVVVHTVHPDEIKSHRVVGCISYSSDITQSAMDFNCTGEAFGAIDLGEIIVSKRFRDMVKTFKIKGVQFSPVLDTSTQLYAEYHSKLQYVMERLRSNPANKW